MVARSWHRDTLERILSRQQPEGLPRIQSSPYLCLPLMSIVGIARYDVTSSVPIKFDKMNMPNFASVLNFQGMRMEKQ